MRCFGGASPDPRQTLNRHDHPALALGTRAAKDTIFPALDPEDLRTHFWALQKFRLFLSIRPSVMAFLAPWRLGISDWG